MLLRERLGFLLRFLFLSAPFGLEVLQPRLQTIHILLVGLSLFPGFISQLLQLGLQLNNQGGLLLLLRFEGVSEIPQLLDLLLRSELRFLPLLLLLGLRALLLLDFILEFGDSGLLLFILLAFVHLMLALQALYLLAKGLDLLFKFLDLLFGLFFRFI